MTDQISAQVVIGALMAYILQWLKRSTWFPMLNENAAKITKVAFSMVAAAATALSLDWQFDSAAGVFTITGLTSAHLWNAAMAFGVSFLSQHSAYHLLVRPAETPKV